MATDWKSAWERKKAACRLLDGRLQATERALANMERDRDDLRQQLSYWENVAPNTHPELIVSTLMEERDEYKRVLEIETGLRANGIVKRKELNAQISDLEDQVLDLEQRFDIVCNDRDRLTDERDTVQVEMVEADATWCEKTEELRRRLAQAIQHIDDLTRTLTGELRRQR